MIGVKLPSASPGSRSGINENTASFRESLDVEHGRTKGVSVEASAVIIQVPAQSSRIQQQHTLAGLLILEYWSSPALRQWMSKREGTTQVGARDEDRYAGLFSDLESSRLDNAILGR